MHPTRWNKWRQKFNTLPQGLKQIIVHHFAHQIWITLHNLSTWFLFKAKLNWDKRKKLTSSFRYINRRAAIPLMPWQYPTSYQTNKQTNHAYMCFVCDCYSLLSSNQLCTMYMQWQCTYSCTVYYLLEDITYSHTMNAIRLPQEATALKY